MNATPVDFSGILDRFREIDNWLSSLGLTGRNRMRIYGSNLAAMLRLNEGTDPARVYADLEAKGKLTEILSSYVEGIEFVDAITVLRDRNIDIPVEVLVKTLRGPVDAYREDQASNGGRNFMFELVIGAMVARAGLTPTLGSEPDVVFGFENRKVLVECKRVMSQNKIEERIRQAARQLKARVRSEEDFGIIAISVTRTINSGNVIWSVPSVSDASPFLNSQVEKVIRRLDGFLQTLSQPGIFGIIFYISSPIFVPGVGFSPVKSATVYPLPALRDQSLLRRLAHVLQTG
jgi:hypothetical protein